LCERPAGRGKQGVTIAEIRKGRGYATAAIGKWHLGHRPQFLPMQQGFDTYYGIPYSNHMDGTGRQACQVRRAARG
jgi:uncharacterized sulfatase